MRRRQWGPLSESDLRPSLLDIVNARPAPPPPLSGTQRLLRQAPVPVIERTVRLYGWLERVAFLTTPACVLLGIWVDPRWLATTLVPAAAWVLSHAVIDACTAELDRRREEAESECPDEVEGTS